MLHTRAYKEARERERGYLRARLLHTSAERNREGIRKSREAYVVGKYQRIREYIPMYKYFKISGASRYINLQAL